MPNLPSTRLYFGGDYNPEQWPEDVWIEDMGLMKEAGVNLVSIAIFAWSRLQSAPGVFHFGWLDRLMDLLDANGIQADLATATASPPAWLIRRHPDILPTLDNGTRLSQGSRQHYNPSSRAYRKACAELVTALAERYQSHPALAMWHINNEYACHVPADYGDETAAAFRVWLQNRYPSLDALNDAWGTAFWSQHYYDWEEILPPRAAPSFQNPGQCLDFQRFSSDALLECYLVEAEILRRVTPGIPITTNFMEWVKPLDYRNWAQHLDFACLDIYPEPTGTCRPLAQNADMTRSFKDGKPWLIMEQVTTQVNWRNRNATKPPGLMRLWSYQSIARGADGICFFQWRQARAGAEKFHGSMVGHGDPASQRCFQETKQLGRELAKLGEIAGTRFQAQAAIYFDQENWWALELPGKPNNDLKYNRAVENFYQALQKNNLPTDFVFEGSDLSAYKLLFVPSLYLIKPGVAEKLETYVASGGIAVFTYFSGIVDEYDRVQLGGYPAPLRKLLGLTVEEWSVPPNDEPFPLRLPPIEGFDPDYHASFWAEVIRTEGAEAIASFASGYYSGLAAVTRNRFGQGQAWYLGTELEPAFYEDLIRHLSIQSGVAQLLAVPEGVEVCERQGESARYLFLLNHNTTSVEINLGSLRGLDLLSGEQATSSWKMSPRGVTILKVFS